MDYPIKEFLREIFVSYFFTSTLSVLHMHLCLSPHCWVANRAASPNVIKGMHTYIHIYIIYIYMYVSVHSLMDGCFPAQAMGSLLFCLLLCWHQDIVQHLMDGNTNDRTVPGLPDL